VRRSRVLLDDPILTACSTSSWYTRASVSPLSCKNDGTSPTKP
jgi:hypothetical protein